LRRTSCGGRLAASGLAIGNENAKPQVSCTGKIVDANGRSVVGANVMLVEMVSDGIAGNIVLNKVGDLVTADDGAFAFTVARKPNTGTFMEAYIIARKDGWSIGWTIWEMRKDAAATITLDKPQTIGGRVVDGGGKPITDATVVANLLRTGQEDKQWFSGLALPDWFQTRTDGQGRFTFGHLPPNAAVAYLVTAAGWATTYVDHAEPDEHFPSASGPTGVKLIVPREGRITGKIIDPDTNQGVPNFKFAIAFSGLFYYRFVCSTAEDGTFTVAGLRTAKYLIHRNHSLPHTEVDVRSGETTTVMIHANTPYYGRILYDDGEPLETWDATPTPKKPAVSLWEGPKIVNTQVAELDEAGYFEVFLSREQFDALQSGKTQLHVNIPLSDKQTTSIRNELPSPPLSRDKAKVSTMKIPRKDYRSLIGKSLPDLKELGLNPTLASDRPILMCLVDMEQRPCRQCLSELAKKKETLSASHIDVVIARTSVVDLKQYEDWLKTIGISDPIHGVAPDFESKRLRWGVRALPWLILTDKNRVVRAEGFAIDDLDKTLQAGK
jgi:hypothetical protein